MEIKVILFLALATANCAVLPSSEIEKVPKSKIVVATPTNITIAPSVQPKPAPAPQSTSAPVPAKLTDTSAPAQSTPVPVAVKSSSASPQPSSAQVAAVSPVVTVKNIASPVAPTSGIQTDSAINKDDSAKKTKSDTVSTKKASETVPKGTLTNKKSSAEKSEDDPAVFSFLNNSPLVFPEYEVEGFPIDFDDDSFDDNKDEDMIEHNYFTY